ncbi:threonine/serine exporter family protein [Lachnospiraceae bacterium ZAX-1]
MEDSKHVLHLAVSIGESLLKNGGEIYRVQETVIRILEAYDIKDYNVYVVSNGMFATVNEDKDDASSMVRALPLGDTNLGRIMQVNHLSREVCEHKCTLEEARIRLIECENSPMVGKWGMMLASGISCACFCYLFGGKRIDSVATFFIGMLLELFVDTATKRNTSKFIVNIIGSAIVTMCSLLLADAGIGILQDKVASGGIVILLPGVVLTTAIRELFNGDYLSGSIHLMDALLTAFCIAIGVGSAMQIYYFIGGMPL